MTSAMYRLPFENDGGWHVSRTTCAGLFLGTGAPSVCPAGGAHARTGVLDFAVM